MNQHYLVQSPNCQLEMKIELTAGDEQLQYCLNDRDESIVLKSKLGLLFEDQDELAGLHVLETKYGSSSSVWTPVYGEREKITDEYNSLQLTLQETVPNGKMLLLEVRVFNHGAAFRYGIPEQIGLKQFKIKREKTQFHFPAGSHAYEEHGSEGKYSKVPINQIKRFCERPLTVMLPSGKWACVAEAGLNDYSRMLLSPEQSEPGILVSELTGIVRGFEGYGSMRDEEQSDGKVEGETPFYSPWRVILTGEREWDLLTNNDIILNLNDARRIQNTAWIKPGKVMRVIQLCTGAAKSVIDFAAQHNIPYIEFDAGWYGPEADAGSDARFVHPSLDLNMEEVIAYGKKFGVGVWLYVNRVSLERQLDDLLLIYQQWGVSGIKFGFVNVGPQYWTRWLVNAVKKCAEHKLMVDIHDAYRPTGLSRTYPNLLTQEGVRGNEHMPDSRHNTTLPFTRFPAGAADYTICYYNDRIQNTHAHQLALAVVFYSPLQFVFWYDTPSDYQGEEEISFFEQVPTTWHDSRVLAAKIEHFAVVARRHNENWFVGCITNEHERELLVKLDFIESDTKYRLYLYYDDPQSTSRTGVSVKESIVDSNEVLNLSLLPSGGCAMMMTPVVNGGNK